MTSNTPSEHRKYFSGGLEYLSELISWSELVHGEPLRKEVTVGFILSCDLWNVAYNRNLRTKMPDYIFLVGYEGDMAAVIVARDEESQRNLNQILRWVCLWMEKHLAIE